MSTSSHVSVPVSDPPTPGQMNEFYTQVRRGKITKDSFQEFLRQGPAHPPCSGSMLSQDHLLDDHGVCKRCGEQFIECHAMNGILCSICGGMFDYLQWGWPLAWKHVSREKPDGCLPLNPVSPVEPLYLFGKCVKGSLSLNSSQVNILIHLYKAIIPPTCHPDLPRPA